MNKLNKSEETLILNRLNQNLYFPKLLKTQIDHKPIISFAPINSKLNLKRFKILMIWMSLTK